VSEQAVAYHRINILQRNDATEHRPHWYDTGIRNKSGPTLSFASKMVCYFWIGMGFGLARVSRDWRHKSRETREFLETNSIVLHSRLSLGTIYVMSCQSRQAANFKRHIEMNCNEGRGCTLKSLSWILNTICAQTRAVVNNSLRFIVLV
jgi:hypothetical protein